MRAVLVLACVVCVWSEDTAPERTRFRYGFYLNMTASRRTGPDTARRVFGGEATALTTYPAASVLMDRYYGARCSAAVLAVRWVLTAAHCVSTQLAYVKFNTRHPTTPEGDVAPVHYLYRHPGYKVVQEDEGRGVDVTVLHHDVGLVRTRKDMHLVAPPQLEPITAIRMYNPNELQDAEVQVLGFGRTEKSSLGEELYEVKLRLVRCERGGWFHCVCGVGAARSGDGARGVCSGDSGGPVLYRGVQVGVTSMGPLECAAGRVDPVEGATSVFTSLYNYADLLNATINNAEETLRMHMLGHGAALRSGGAASWPVLVAGGALLVVPAR